jgi:hypothetical protein
MQVEAQGNLSPETIRRHYFREQEVLAGNRAHSRFTETNEYDKREIRDAEFHAHEPQKNEDFLPLLLAHHFQKTLPFFMAR